MAYRHTQVGTVIIIALLALALLTLALTSTHLLPILSATLAILGATVALFCSLTVEIEHGILTCRFGIGIIRKYIPLSEVDQVRAVQNPWFVGWGIRWIPGKCWVWNVSGFRAVELLMKNGRRFRIGTDEPEALVHAIELDRKIAT